MAALPPKKQSITGMCLAALVLSTIAGVGFTVGACYANWLLL